ncbi:hypothetical protein ACHAXR_008327 [Thalassiosira sp. AJA248-18]
MYLLLQLHAPLDEFNRTLYVFGCNDASCYARENGEMGDNNMSISRFYSCILGNAAEGGALRCVRSQQRWKNSSKTNSEMAASDSNNDSGNELPAKQLDNNDWGIDDGSDGWGEDGDDDWGEAGANKTNESTNNISMDDLETMLNNCEVRAASKKSETLPPTKSQSIPTLSTKAPSVHNNTSGNSSANSIHTSLFDHHDLEMINEPITGRRNDDSDEDDNDDFGCSNNDASKVDQMLSRYMDMEDDQEILSALKGGSTNSAGSTNNGKGGGGERYERLPPEERAFLAFTKRLKRAPGQVARYAYGGTPLWSIPLPPSNSGERQQHRPKQQKSKKKSQKGYPPLPLVPKCDCGAERVFEFQILPSLLHVLDVDSEKNGDCDDMMDLISKGGMNWGSIAVYSCSESCDKSREEFMIVQEPVCDAPIKKKIGTNDNSDNDDDMDGK